MPRSVDRFHKVVFLYFRLNYRACGRITTVRSYPTTPPTRTDPQPPRGTKRRSSRRDQTLKGQVFLTAPSFLFAPLGVHAGLLEGK